MSENNGKMPLGQVSTLYDSLHKTPSYADEGISMVRVTDIRRGFVDLTDTKKVDVATFQEFTKKYAPTTGDILFTRVGSYGNSCYVNKPLQFCLGQNTVCITSKTDVVLPFYLYCCLNSPQTRQQIDSFVGGASQPTISLKNIRLLEIPTPPLPTQRKIASVLSVYDDLIENNTRRIAILEEMAQVIYRDWFVNFRFPGHESIKLVDSPLGEIPEGWEAGTVGDFGKIITGKTPSKKRPELFGGDIQFVRTPDMHGNLFCLSTADTLTEEGMASQPKQTVPPNSVCISCIGTVGVISITASTCQTNQQINTIIPKTAHWREYIVLALKESTPRLKQMGAGGATMDNISKGKLTAFDVLLPPDAILHSFAPYTANFFDQIQLLQRHNDNLRTTRDLLLPKLISGKLDVEDLDIDVGEHIEELEEATA